MRHIADLSIIIPVFNQMRFTRICVESLKPTLPEGSEVIIVDNGSLDNTSEYLSGLHDVRVITNKDNRGCAAAWNQGVRASNSSWVAVLNNDIILSTGWFEGLLDFAEEKGLDIVSPAFREGEYNYDIADYSKNFIQRMRQVSRMGVAQGICFMVRRSVFARIGFFDEKFRVGQFEDADFFRRAGLAGFRLGTTGRSFIHHFGSATQNSIRKENSAGPFEEENRAYFRNKYNLTTGKRFIEKRRDGLQALYWRVSERLRYGHTLIEKWINNRLRYF